MRAVRIRKATTAAAGRYAVHWLTDDDGTVCGLDLETLTVVEELADVDVLPSVEGCRSCARAVAREKDPDYGRSRRVNDSVDTHLLGLPATAALRGRVSKVGPLRRGTGRSGHGNRLY